MEKFLKEKSLFQTKLFSPYLKYSNLNIHFHNFLFPIALKSFKLPSNQEKNITSQNFSTPFSFNELNDKENLSLHDCTRINFIFYISCQSTPLLCTSISHFIMTSFNRSIGSISHHNTLILLSSNKFNC